MKALVAALRMVGTTMLLLTYSVGICILAVCLGMYSAVVGACQLKVIRALAALLVLSCLVCLVAGWIGYAAAWLVIGAFTLMLTAAYAFYKS